MDLMEELEAEHLLLERWGAGQPLEVVPDVPDWLSESPPSWDVVGPRCGDARCSCLMDPDRPCTVLSEEAPRTEEVVRWAVPGVWDDEPAPFCLPPVGAAVAAVQEAVGRLEGCVPSDLPGPLALAEVEALQETAQRLRVLLLPRLADVKRRELFALVGFHGVGGWQEVVAPDADRRDSTLANRLDELPALKAALAERRVSVSAAQLVAKSMTKVGRYLDRPDGLIDGQPGDEVVEGIIDNTVDLVCRARGGVEPDDPFLQVLTDQVELVHVAGGSQAARVEAAFVLLAEHVPTCSSLEKALEQQEGAVLPNLLEEQLKAAEQRRGASLRRHRDGSWELEGRLTPECGERLFTALAAEARRDPGNPVDTLARQQARNEQLREQGRDPFTDGGLKGLPAWEQEALGELALLPGREHAEQVADLQELGLTDGEAEEAALLVPRSRSRRLHDALNRLLASYLEAGLGGTHDKVPVQVTVAMSSAQVEQRPGALPATAGSGALVARSLLKRWWGDSHVTTLILAKGWTPIGLAHSGRTHTAKEGRAVRIRWGDRCAGADCCSGEPDLLLRLILHHVRMFSRYGRTVLDETLPLCERAHQDLHVGKRVLRLRDGRLLTEDGFLDEQ